MKRLLTAVALGLSGLSVAHEETYQNPVDNRLPAEAEKYHNPVDQKTHVAPGAWSTYAPSEGATSTLEKVALVSVRLLQKQEEIADRTAVQEPASFIDRAHRAATEVFASSIKPAVLLVQFTCVPDNCPASIAFQGEPARELLQAYQDRLKQLAPLRVSGEVKFQFTLKVQP